MHPEPKSLKFRYLRRISLALTLAFLALVPATMVGAEPLPYAENFNPANGFKPAQRNLTAIFLQMAGSFEHYGTPANYLRHVNVEAKRVEAAWFKAKGKPAKFRPEYFTEEYIEKLITGWNQMAPILALEGFTRNSGRKIRYAILGTAKVPPEELAELEKQLGKPEAAEFQRFLAKPFFVKSDFPAMEAFYKDGSGYDKLSDSGRMELNKRVWRGTMDQKSLDADLAASKSPTLVLSILGEHQEKVVLGINGRARPSTADDLRDAMTSELRLKVDEVNLENAPASSRDGVAYAHSIKSAMASRLKDIGSRATPQQMNDIIGALNLMYENLLVAAQLELETGLWQHSLEN